MATIRKKPKIITLGPVNDLEYYVKKEWRKDIFNANYLRTDGDVVEDENITDTEIKQFLEILGLDSKDHILDLCCGQGRHTFALADLGFPHLSGFDRSRYLINRAKKKAKNRGYDIIFKEGDARKIKFPDDSFNAVLLLGNSFGYFDSIDSDTRVLQEIQRVLKPGGNMLIDIPDGDHMKEKFEKRSRERIDKNYFVCRERCLSRDHNKLITREVIIHTKKGIIADQFYAERLYNLESISLLLTKVGFCNIIQYNNIITKSERDQDLGMMNRRIIITAATSQ